MWSYCAAVGLADVTSANVVGYNNVDINPGYNMFAVNFKQMGENQSIKIDDLFPGGGKADTVFTYAAGAADADYVMLWDNTIGDYHTYYYALVIFDSDYKYYGISDTQMIAGAKDDPPTAPGMLKFSNIYDAVDDDNYMVANINTQAVPEPTSGLLLLLGVAGLALKRRRA